MRPTLKLSIKSQYPDSKPKTLLDTLSSLLKIGLALFGVGGLLGWGSRKLFRQQKQYRHPRPGYSLVGNPDPASPNFLQAIEAITGAPYSQNNRIELLINGDQIFPAMLQAIREAKKTVNLVTFVYWKGTIAPQVADAICERARAGVRCNILLDAIGAAKIDRELIEKMRECGARVVWFRPPRWYNLSKLDNRTHRKLLVVDGVIGFTGGVGIAEEWTGNAEDPLHWRDTHVRVVGPAVRGLQGAFCENWLEATGEVLAGKDYLPGDEDWPKFEGAGVKAQVTRSSAGKGDTSVETLFFLALAAARSRIWLTTAYFVPSSGFVQTLISTAKRGVDVRIVVPGPHTNKEVVRQAGRANYEVLLKAGIKIYEYQPTMLHAKTMVVDGIWATIGSTNFDNRSFKLNDETNISVQDRDLAQRLEDQFELDIAVSKEYTTRRWERRSIWPRLKEGFSSIFRREL